MTDKPENERGELPGSVQEAVDSYARYYADHHKLGMSIREDMTYIAQVAMRWCVPVDAAEIEAAADELRWYAKHLGDFHGKPNKPWTEHFNDDINALRNMALVEKERADRLAALTAQPQGEPVAWRRDKGFIVHYLEDKPDPQIYGSGWQPLYTAPQPGVRDGMQQIGMAWIHKDGAVWEFEPENVREETLGMLYVPVYITRAAEQINAEGRIESLQLPPLNEIMYHAVRGLELDFGSGESLFQGSIDDDTLDLIWESINTALRCAKVSPSAPPSAPQTVVDTCDQGHKFAKLPDHPKRNSKARCPHCMAIGLDATRQPQTVRVPVDTLKHWAEYWNGSANEKAMSDALEHILGEVDELLRAAQKEATP